MEWHEAGGTGEMACRAASRLAGGHLGQQHLVQGVAMQLRITGQIAEEDEGDLERRSSSLFVPTVQAPTGKIK